MAKFLRNGLEDSMTLQVGRISSNISLISVLFLLIASHFRYTCNHCQTKFETLFSYAQHCFNLPASERVLKCYLCKSTSRGISFLATYLNHMSREHFPHIKFCCINCSAVFCNMKQLSTHYQKQHISETLVIYPCLDCGHYSHCISALRSHKQQHDPKP